MITLNLTEAHVSEIMAALMERPWVKANPILLAIDAQVAAQQAVKKEGKENAID
jgi:hypothetical protein